MAATIRTAVAADAQEVRSLFAAHLRELGLHPHAGLDADMNDFPRAYHRPGAHFLVAEAPSGVLVGMAGLLEGEVRRVFVKPDWRGQGIARRLVLTLVGRVEATSREPSPRGRRREEGGASLSASSRRRLRFMAAVQVRQEQPVRRGHLWAVVARTNEASRRLFEASGFTPTGGAPDHPGMQHCEILERSWCGPVSASAR